MGVVATVEASFLWRGVFLLIGNFVRIGEINIGRKEAYRGSLSRMFSIVPECGGNGQGHQGGVEGLECVTILSDISPPA